MWNLSVIEAVIKGFAVGNKRGQDSFIESGKKVSATLSGPK